ACARQHSGVARSLARRTIDHHRRDDRDDGHATPARASARASACGLHLSVSHELRTPLSQILLFAETLNLGRVRTDQARRTATGVIVHEGRRLMPLVENILHFSRAERRMTRLGPEPIDLSRAVATVIEDWLPLAGAADVRVETRFAVDVHALADRGALRQMVLNLLDNAV